MSATVSHPPLTKRRLLLRDSLTFVVLTLFTIALFVVTLLLFRSFARHRADLARRWSARGSAALSSGHPQEAIVALRAALVYSPGDASYQLLLAQALGAAGRTSESQNYFLNLWDSRPGDGSINLQLARLNRRTGDRPAAINYYRASIYGTWEGDGIVRRRDVRLELADYLIQLHDFRGAREELVIAGGNNVDEPELDARLADSFQDAGDPEDALALYNKVLARQPANEHALEQGGRLAFQLGQYERAHSLLGRALEHASGQGRATSEQEPTIAALHERAARVLQLMTPPDLPSATRVSRILANATTAHTRLQSCIAQLTAGGGIVPADLPQLDGSFTAAGTRPTRTALLRSSARQDEVIALVTEAEARAAELCGPPSGDDAVLVLLGRAPELTNVSGKPE